MDNTIKSLSEHNINLFTFSTTKKKYPSNVSVHSKVPFKLRALGLYQKLLMPQHDYSNCDIILSLTAYPVKTDKPLIIYDQNNLADSYDTETPVKYQKGLWKLYFKPYQLLSKTSIIKDAVYLANSKYTAERLKESIGIESKVMYPCVDMTGLYETEKKNQVCVVGRISPEKNLTKTIQILNNINYPCFIFGSVSLGNELYLKELQAIANPNIKFIINRPRNELIDLLAESKIFFSASVETFGITTIESIACGCIPIVPDNSANKETVPFDLLRYSSKTDAINNINHSMISTVNDRVSTKLKEYIKQFSYESFRVNLLAHLNNNKL